MENSQTTPETMLAKLEFDNRTQRYSKFYRKFFGYFKISLIFPMSILILKQSYFTLFLFILFFIVAIIFNYISKWIIMKKKFSDEKMRKILEKEKEKIKNKNKKIVKEILAKKNWLENSEEVILEEIDSLKVELEELKVYLEKLYEIKI